jgi:hypothetical protein
VRVREPNDQELEQASRRARTALGFLQLGGMAFAAVVAIGLVPRLVAAQWPELGAAAHLGAAVAAVLVAFGSVVLGVARLRRTWAEDERRARGDDAPPR